MFRGRKESSRDGWWTLTGDGGLEEDGELKRASLRAEGEMVLSLRKGEGHVLRLGADGLAVEKGAEGAAAIADNDRGAEALDGAVVA